MFAVEAVKVAAHAKGYEVIDVEPKPEWSGSDSLRVSSVHEGRPTEQGGLRQDRASGRIAEMYSRVSPMRPDV